MTLAEQILVQLTQANDLISVSVRDDHDLEVLKSGHGDGCSLCALEAAAHYAQHLTARPVNPRIQARIERRLDVSPMERLS